MEHAAVRTNPRFANTIFDLDSGDEDTRLNALLAANAEIARQKQAPVIHHQLEHGTEIEWKHFLPIAFGISTAISAFILGL